MQQSRLTWFIVSCLLGLIFIIWGAITPNHPLLPGDVWLVLPGLIMFAIGIFGIIEKSLNNHQSSPQ